MIEDIEKRIISARELMWRVFDCHSADEIERAHFTSMLGSWREGLRELDRALEQIRASKQADRPHG